MAKDSGKSFKTRWVEVRQDIDEKILSMANKSLSSLNDQLHKISGDEELSINSDLPKKLAIKILEKAQDIRSHLNKEEIISVSKKTGKQLLNQTSSKVKAAKSKIKFTHNKNGLKDNSEMQ